MPVGCNILRYMDIMLSFEIHNMIIPPAPAPVPGPYFHPSFLGHGDLSGKAKTTLTVKTGMDQPMLQGTCCGYFDPHIGNLANVLLPITILFSASKSVFVSGTVQISSSPPSTAALIIMNLNLNCFFPVSMPLGVVYAFNTVQAGMSIGDYLAGVAFMVMQMVIEKAVGSAMDRIGGSRMVSSAVSRMFMRSVTPNIHIGTPLARAAMAYMGTNGFISGMIARDAAKDIASGVTGYILDQTPLEGGVMAPLSGGAGRAVDSF